MLFDVAPQPGNIPAYAGRTQERSLNAHIARNIPAYAGRTIETSEGGGFFWKHPRIRGENHLRQFLFWIVLETSPHTRGELVWRIPTEDAHGNIPAYAGRTGCPKNPARLRQKHPRIRGENTPQHLAGGRITETSPHTRGEHRRSVFMRARQGNIPAYAGRTRG